MKGKVNVQSHLPSSGQRHHDRHIEFGILPLHVFRPILLPKVLDHRFHCFRLGNWRCPELRFCASRINPNCWILEDILISLRLGALHGKEVELLAFNQ